VEQFRAARYPPPCCASRKDYFLRERAFDH
jgi:hypothetical protein